MRPFVLSVLCTLFLLVSLPAAFPWRPYGLKLAPRDWLDKRAAAAVPATTVPTPINTGLVTSGSSAAAQATNVNSGTGANSAATTTTGPKHKGTNSNATTTSTSSISINPQDPPGGVSMMNPNPDSTTYFMIGNWVTFAWNYTSLQVTPTAVNVVATCTLNRATYTIAENMSVEATGSVLWDTGEYQATATVPLLTASYTLVIWDANRSIDAFPSPGLLYSQHYPFAMYTPQSYTPLSDFVCPTCSGALSDMERNGLRFMTGMILITILSFTWFAGGVLAT